MKMYALQSWEKITQRPSKIAPELKKMIDSTTDQNRWKLRKCDRDDTDDWMPYKTITDDCNVRTYYVNTNELSPAHKHMLVMRVGAVVIIEEWLNNYMISSVCATVERKPTVDEPAEEEKAQIRDYMRV